MKKSALVICLLVVTLKLIAQKNNEIDKLKLYSRETPLNNEFAEVDTFVKTINTNYKSIPELAQKIFSPFTTDADKVRTAFIWITNNIAYDTEAYHTSKNTTTRFSYKTNAERIQKIEKANYDYAAAVLIKKKGVCEGYATLFYELCKYARIDCEVVQGYASMNMETLNNKRNQKSFIPNHAWNKVKLGTTWYYIDATWASGYCDKPIQHFYKKFEPYYYLTPIQKLYKTHLLKSK
ncbi:MAG: transglutaminase domain-containing protein [Bacteroidia bacterium]